MRETLLQILPHSNGFCNFMACILVITGLSAIRARKIELHKKLMLLATVFSAIFLIGYITRHILGSEVKFQGQGLWRPIYFTILITHMILAVVNLPLVIVSVVLGLRNRIDRHKKWVRFTAPIWLYVSSTGVIIYLMLFHLF